MIKEYHKDSLSEKQKDMNTIKKFDQPAMTMHIIWPILNVKIIGRFKWGPYNPFIY